MSDHIPFDIQSQILERLPVKSLVQFRSVSQQWKAFIDNPKFINNYHVNHPNPQHHLFLRYELDNVQKYTSITDNNTFPKQKFPLTAPESLSSLRNALILVGSVDGLLCFYYFRGPYAKNLVVIWNPTIRKSVSIDIPSHKPRRNYTVVGFGVCPHTRVPKLVKITVDTIASMWDVVVFTLSTRAWKTMYTGAPFKSCYLARLQVFVDGVIYFGAWRDIYLDGVRFNYIISFNLKSEKFGEVCLPDRLVHAPCLQVTKVNESLGLLEYYNDGEMTVCGVWTRKDDANKTFSKIYTIKVEGKSLDRVLVFRNNGEAVIEVDADSYGEFGIEVYQPLSGHTNGVVINGKKDTFSVRSYMETLLLLDETDAVIY